MSGDESALARALREDAAADAPGASAIDVAEATRRSRARRLPAQLALGAAAVALVLGVGVAAVGGLALAPPAFIAADGAREESAEQPGGGDSTGGEAAPSTPVARCGAPVDDAVGDDGEAGAPGLRLEVDLPERAEADGDAIEGTIRIVNDGSRRVTGTASAPPTVIGSRDGVARWTSAAEAAAGSTAIELDPGESTVIPVRVRPVACVAADDGSSADDAAPPPGAYELSAFLTVTPSTAGAAPVRVTSETVVIVLE